MMQLSWEAQTGKYLVRLFEVHDELFGAASTRVILSDRLILKKTDSTYRIVVERPVQQVPAFELLHLHHSNPSHLPVCWAVESEKIRAWIRGRIDLELDHVLKLRKLTLAAIEAMSEETSESSMEM